MAMPEISTLSIGSVFPLSKQLRLGSNTRTAEHFSSFNCLKAAPSVNCFLGRASSTISLWHSVKAKSRGPKLKARIQVVAQAGSYKVAILGVAGGIGEPLSLLIKMSPLISALHLHDIEDIKGVSADLSHCNTPAQVIGFTGPEELAESLNGVDVVVIAAGVPRKPGMTRDDLFDVNADIVKGLIEAVADNAPQALIHIITNPVNSTVPIAAEILKQKGVHNRRKLFGVTTLDVVRANTFVAQKKNLPLADVDIPVVGGHSCTTILPLLSKASPKTTFTDEEVKELTMMIQNAGTDVVEAKAGDGSATLSMAYAAARFVESSLRGLDGDADIYECSYVQSELTELPFFASRVKLGREGIEEVIGLELKGLTEYEACALEALKPQLKANIDKGIAYGQHTAATPLT